MIWHKNEFFISDEKHFLDVEYISEYLSLKSYWAENIPIELVRRSIEGSFCFGLYFKPLADIQKATQVGFARVVTDKATFGYLADVFIGEDYRGIGLGKWLMEIIMAHPSLQGFRSWMLATRDAHGLYAKFGFGPLEQPERIMRKHDPDIYKKPIR
jgi:GNAT superfamily N-acetyltransferase